MDELQNLTASLQKIAPNLRAEDRFNAVEARLTTTNKDFEDAKEQARNATKAFEEKKRERYEKFMEAFKHISGNIEKIYKSLTKSDTHVGGTAYLNLESTHEPYLFGIKFNAMPPGKRFRDIEQLSGGEKTLAALALLFAIHR